MRKITFNENWTFAKGTGSALASLFGPDELEVTTLNLPHDALITTERVDYPLGNGMGFYKPENVNYTKEFIIDNKNAEVVYIEFEGIYQNAFVYVNNAFAGRCTFGYGNHFINITRFLDLERKNIVKVVVKNDLVSGRWYTGSGIYRNVHLHIGRAVHIPPTGARYSTTEVEDDQAVIRAVIPIENVSYSNYDTKVRTKVFDSDQNLVCENESVVTVFGQEKKEVAQQLVISKPKLWNVDDPNLYFIESEILNSEEQIDSYSCKFGVRKLQLDAKKGLRINGKSVKLRGGCIHHDSGILGAATYYEAEERRIKRLKEAGYNAIRMSHHPASKAMLEACDKIGMLVMDEFTDVWTTSKLDYDYGFHFDLCWEQDVENMVYKDFNHPSVIIYSIGNEIPETGNKFDSDWGKKIVEKIRTLDSTRYTTNCVNFMLSALHHMDEIFEKSGVQSDQSSMEINTMMEQMEDMTSILVNAPLTSKITEETFGQVDIAGYNYAESRYESDIDRYPNRIILGSETNPPKLAQNWSLVEKHPQIIGDFTWTAWDYLGEAGGGRITYGDNERGYYAGYPWRLNYTGTIDILGNRRPISYLREIIWGLRKRPYIAVRPPIHFGKKMNSGQWALSDSIRSWNWEGFEGKPIVVEVYSDAEEVELFINDISVGIKHIDKSDQCMAIFETNYVPGKVKVIARKDGQEYADSVLTAKTFSKIKLTSDQLHLHADGKGICFVEISMSDEYGNWNPSVEELISIELDGPGELIAFGSANPQNEDNYGSNIIHTFEGRALAVIRATKEKGISKIKVRSKNIESEEVQLKFQ